MEDILLQSLQSGNLTSIVCAVVVYIIIHYQRKSTGDERNDEFKKLQNEINEIKIENELKQKDIDLLKTESIDIKQDFKEMKACMQSIQISLEKITAYYDFMVKQQKE